MNYKPLISILLSTYNGHKYITESIDSVMYQSYKNFELIIINDCSDDQVGKIIQNYAQKDPRIISIKNKKNLWLTRSLNKAIKVAKWDYIARIDDDDIWTNPNKLRNQVNFMEKNPDYWVCGTSKINIDATWKTLTTTQIRETDSEIRKKLLQSNQFVHSSVVIRKSTLDLVWWYYNNDFNGAEDYELWLRIWRVAQLHNITTPDVAYRILPSSISQKNVIKQESLTIQALCKNRSFYNGFYTAILLRVGYLVLRVFKIKK